MPTALVTITKKHKYSMGTPDGGGNKMIEVIGEITMSTFTQTTAGTDGMELNLSSDILNLEGVTIQGDAGYIVQYNYATSSTNPSIEVYVQNSWTGAAPVLVSTTSDDLLNGKVFKFRAWGF